MNTEHPPSLALERYLLAEIDRSTSAGWIAHIDTCPECQATLIEMRKTGEAFAATAKLPHRRRSLATRIAWIAIPLAAAIALIILLPRPPPHDFTPKGRGVFAIEINGQPSDPMRAIPRGAELQMSWTAAEPGWIAVIGKEKSGETSVLFPEGAGEAAKIESGSRRKLGRTIIADEAIDGAELIVLFDAARFATHVDLHSFTGQVERMRLTLEGSGSK